MSERRTRRQAALAAAAVANDTPTKSNNNDDVTMNGKDVSNDGNGLAVAPSESKVDNSPRENIFVFWPNIIGYSRIVLAIASLYYMPLHPRTCSILYSISCLLDALDGYAARYFEQSTKFGAVLDMVTDRCTTSCLLVFLSSAFPRWAIVFQGLISVDFASHYTHMYATLAMGGSDSSHKNVDKSRSWLLNLYYTNKTVLFICCALNEVFFIALYLLSFSSPLLSPQLLEPLGETRANAIQTGAQVNSSVLRQLFTNPYSAGALEMARANKMDSTFPWILAGVSAPIMALKQFLNVVQLVKASRWLGEGDVEARKKAGLPRRKNE
ncbi:CDP-alcohol phosphatidyltransferase-domain-containing protein [Annulohypoxylon maeteangense]|uniref:CDP-alcohol phosphatidyltransferase-domain-containing protein n=1 Tax=Annulohypoxylon maeteangense TaxID=1927788 RepID=UPI0020074063|nr:CDP-alcohol phosphatidyltransferase-domain-containing protein [Annulohypoxylon maeteangense]KAI0884874.1 CDP-alcohol phosphatidyltransferase-domain-containing protein [Annulohypoxylon maeteangense]